MKTLFVIREQLKSIYSKYEIYITPILKFLMTFIALSLINGQLGYMTKIDKAPLVLIVALACSVLPTNLIIVIAALFSLLHLYALSIECAAVALVVFLLLFLLYFRFSPKDTVVVLLTPMCFAIGIPYAIPLAMGLIGTPASAVSVGCGVIVYFMLRYIGANVQTLNSLEADSELQKFRYVVDGLLNNKAMMVVIVSFTATIIVVYLIRRLSVDYSWTIAIVAGSLSNIVILLMGDLLLSTNISIGMMILQSIFSVVCVLILQFMVFNVDYTRTEMVQFEDDEYYYYVKAVPKNVVAKADKTVKRITTPKKPAHTPAGLQRPTASSNGAGTIGAKPHTTTTTAKQQNPASKINAADAADLRRTLENRQAYAEHKQAMPKDTNRDMDKRVLEFTEI